MTEALIFDAVRTPIGRYGGMLSGIRTDDLGAVPLRALLSRNPEFKPALIGDVFMGCANQAGEDNRNVGRMSTLLAGLPTETPAVTVNRLCGSGMEAVGAAARAIRCGEIDTAIAAGVESMSRAPFVLPKTTQAFGRQAELYDTTIGWRFINPLLKSQYGVDSMPETAENVAAEFSVSREDQDQFALWSQQKCHSARETDRFADEIVPVADPGRHSEPVLYDTDEHPRGDTTVEKLAALPTPFRVDGSVTAGNSSGINDGACALLIGSSTSALAGTSEPLARVVAMASAGVAPRVMGIGPVSASRRVLGIAGLSLNQMDVIELNEAFAAQALAVTRELGLADDDPRVNPNGGAIALGHPLGMSGARLVTTAAYELKRRQARYALCAMCVGVGQGIAMLLERP
ncbi:MAG TPA: 3-oxoadipyl-CoA thiolase [Arenicellales bacterium]|jgi:acetyl-CoA acyltransferase|nr:3-oxoadipyl-CoA thiolase [Arenicellales bacterium]HCF73677.1 3-oxoadipyl-CoA thiolase [Gammaproteobacteria bacterium]HJP10535.1 3-oxoadipyl-CoA thiolase [Arenicellales bacterium]|tara:strand:- start:10513 stop:11718 length:1206 start_codon:yes stop_codon:yes gene_type:complete